MLAFWTGLASVAIGAPLAWLTARTNVPAKGLIRALVMASFVTPPFLGAFAWVMLAGPNAGLLNTTWRAVTGSADPLFNIFTMTGLVFVVTMYTFPYVYIMLANTLALIASDLEDAAAIHGAGRMTVAFTITLPMVLPAIVSGFILAVLQALALFGSPAILALPAGFHTITTQVWSFFQFPPKVEQAAAVSIPLLLATALLLLFQKRLLGRRGYASVGGKGGQRRTIALGIWRYPALAGVLVIMACSIFLPYAILAKAAFSRAWAQPLTWSNLTLANWSFTLFEYGSTQAAIVNTLELGVATATVGAVLVALLAYVDQPPARHRPPGGGVPRAGADRDPGRGPRRGALHRLHAAALRALRHARDPLHRVSHQGDAGGLRAVGRDVPQHPRRPRGGGPHPRRRAPAHPRATSRRRSRAAGSSPRGASSSSA